MRLLKLLLLCGVGTVGYVAIPPLWASVKVASTAALIFASANPLLVGMGALCFVLAIVSASLRTPPAPPREAVWNRAPFRVGQIPSPTRRIYTPAWQFQRPSVLTQVPLTPVKPKSVKERLEAILYKEELPDEFLDPISLEPMDNPLDIITEMEILGEGAKGGDVIVRTQTVHYILDLKTFEDLEARTKEGEPVLQPQNRLPVLRCQLCPELKATINEVIKVLEENAADCKSKPLSFR